MNRFWNLFPQCKELDESYLWDKSIKDFDNLDDYTWSIEGSINLIRYGDVVLSQEEIKYLTKAAKLLYNITKSDVYIRLLDAVKSQVHLRSFVRAQKQVYNTALKEVKSGKKTTHWIWYIFPQMKGLGKSGMSQTYAIKDRPEAYAYIAHPYLKRNLVEISEAVLNNKKSVYEIFGNDAIKVRSCMKLFSTVSNEPVFKRIIAKYRW